MTLGQKLAADEAGTYGAPIRAAEAFGLGYSEESAVFEPVRFGDSSEAIGDTRSALTWKMGVSKRDVEGRLEARGRLGADLKAGLVETSGRVGLRPSRL